MFRQRWRVRPLSFTIMLTMMMAFGGVLTNTDASRQQETSTTLTLTVNLCIASGGTERAEAVEPVDGVALEV